MIFKNVFALFFLSILLSNSSHAQTSQTGLRGMVAVPVAELVEDGNIQVGFQTNPGTYKFVINSNRKPPYNNERLFFINLGFIPRVNLLVALTRDVDRADTIRQGIGDRAVQASFQILKEGANLPSLVMNIADPFFSTNQYQNTNHVLMSKSFKFMTSQKIVGSLGYGLPYTIVWRQQSNRSLSETDATFLTNIFGGVQWSYKDKLFLSLEHDGQKMNAGAGLLLFDRLSMEFNLLGMRYPGLGLSYTGKVK